MLTAGIPQIVASTARANSPAEPGRRGRLVRSRDGGVANPEDGEQHGKTNEGTGPG